MSEPENHKDESQYAGLTAVNRIDPNAYPSFKKAFWLVFALIFSVQIVQTYYAFKIGMSGQVSTAVYLNIEIISITWYILSVIIIHYSFTNQNLNPWAFYRFDINILKKHLPQTLKYFAGTALVVILLSIVSSGTELQLEDQPSTIIILMLFTAVIMAPICEELVFRGYDPCYALISRHGEDITFWAYAVAGAILLTSLVISMPFCRWFCPFAAVLNPFSQFGFARVQRHVGDCQECGLCAENCPMAIPVDQVDQVTAARCISCLDCMDVCPGEKAASALTWGPPARFGQRWS